MPYTPNYSSPTVEDSSYVLLVLVTGVLKRSIPEMVTFNNFSPEVEGVMIKTGTKLINGSISTKEYITTLETQTKKEVGKSVKFDDYVITQLTGRLDLSKNGNTANRGLEKESGKKITQVGTMKPMSENKSSKPKDKQELAFKILKKEGHRFGEGEFNSDVDYIWELNNAKIQKPNSVGYYYISESILVKKKNIVLKEENKVKNDPRFDALPQDSKMLVWKTLHKLGVLENFSDIITKQKLDFTVNYWKRYYKTFSDRTRYEVEKLLPILDSQNWKQYKPEPVVQDYQLNSVDKDNTKVLKEDLDPETYDRMEGLANVRDLGNLQILLKLLTHEWIREGFEKDDIVSYLTTFINNEF
jgi:hypothetical protein